MGILRRIYAIARKEIRQLKRDFLTMGFVVGVPAVQLLLFGYAINQDVRHIKTAVVDHTNSFISRSLIDQLQATQTFKVVTSLENDQIARKYLRKGIVKAVIIIPPDYTKTYYRGRGAEIAILVDATDPILAKAAQTSAKGLMEKHNKRLQIFNTGDKNSAHRLPRHRSLFGTEPDLIKHNFLRFEVINLYNPELRTPIFVVPALLGVILTTTMILMTSLSIVREREGGSFEFLIATPVSRLELMIGKIIPYILIGIIQVIIVIVVGLVLFSIPIAGNLLHMGFFSILFIAANLTLGLVISSITASQLQATQLSFFFFLPSVLLSGFMFPFHSMPIPAQWLGEILPLTHFIRVARGILLRGSTIFEHFSELGALLAFTFIGFFLATILFKKRLD